MKTKLKIIIIMIIVLILSLYGINIYKKYNIINEISKKYLEFNNLENYYYCCDKLSPENMIEELWKKDGIIKMIKRSKENNQNLIFLKDESSKESYIISEATKTYEKSPFVYDAPNILLGGAEEKTINKFIINPFTNIKLTNYDNKECYFIKYNNIEEYIDV